MAQPRTPITAPTARPPRYGLIALAEDAGLSPEALAAGYVFDPELCGTDRGGIVAVECTGNTDPRTPGFDNPNIAGDPFVIWSADECSTFGFAARDWVGRAQRALRSTESYWLANEFWMGTLGLTQRSLVDASAQTLTVGGITVAKGIAEVEAALAAQLMGNPGMVHMSMRILQLAMSDDAIWRDGAVWRTASGNLVVADAGYTGIGPSGSEIGASEFIYGTGMVSVALGPVETLPSSTGDAAGQALALDRSVNTMTVYADRLATWVWDPCVHVAAQVYYAEG